MKRKSILSLVALLSITALGLGSCNNKTSSESVVSSTSSSQDSSSSSSSSAAPEPSDSLTAEMLEEAAQGYSIEASLVNSSSSFGSATPNRYVQAMTAQANQDFYHVTSYVGTYDSDEAPLDEIEKDQYYTHIAVGSNTYAAEAKIGISNTVEADSIQLPWNETFQNFFAVLTPEDFAKTATEYTFRLDVDKISDALGEAIMTQSCGSTGYLLESFEIQTDGFHIVSFSAVSTKAETYLGGEMQQAAECTVLSLGEDAFTPLKAYEGTSDADFDAAMAKLAKGNYHVQERIYSDDETEASSIVDVDVSDGVLVWDAGVTINYFTNWNGNLVEITRMENEAGDVEVYKDGYYLPDCSIPTFHISSIFFDKNADGSYSFDFDSYPDILPEVTDIDPLDSDTIDTLKVEIDIDKITFTAENAYSRYVVTYSQIGEVEDSGITVPEDLDYFRISDGWGDFQDTVFGYFGLSDLDADDAWTILDSIPI